MGGYQVRGGLTTFEEQAFGRLERKIEEILNKALSMKDCWKYEITIKF